MWNYEAEEAKAVIVIVHGAMEYHGRYEAVAEMWNHIGYHVVMGGSSVTWNDFKK